MPLNKSHLALLLGGAALWVGIFGFTRRVPHPQNKKGAEKAAVDTAELSPQLVLQEARRALDSTQTSQLAELERQRAQAKSIAEEVEAYKQISGFWNGLRRYEAGGYYAEKVAELEPNGETWGMAGTTYGIAFQMSADAGVKKFAAKRAIEAFQKAAAAQPDTVRHRVNEALMFVELSGVDPANTPPMTGAQKLLALDKQYPDNVLINMSLGKLSLLRSGDIQKAVPRFEKIVALAATKEVPMDDLIEAHYMLIDCYKKLENREKTLEHFAAVKKLAAPNSVLFKQLVEEQAKYEQTGQ